MKRLTSILLLYAILLAQTELSQLFKIPVLIQHYIEHQTESAQFSIADFFQVHYINKSIKDKDYDRDMQLPFKSGDFKSLTTSSATVPVQSGVFIHIPLINITPYIDGYSAWIPSLRVSDIWQPPRLS